MSHYRDKYQFLQIDLENVTKVTRISTQGLIHNNQPQWTKTYTLDYSEDGGTFIPYLNGQVQKLILHLHIMIGSLRSYYGNVEDNVD